MSENATADVAVRDEQDNPQVAQLRALADWLDEHPTDAYRYIATAGGGFIVYHGVNGGDAATQMAALTREYGGRWDKGTTAMGDYELSRQVVPGVTYRLYTARENVCERVVVGKVEVEEPDPKAVAALPTVKRTIEKVEWICPPSLLAGVGEGSA